MEECQLQYRADLQPELVTVETIWFDAAARLVRLRRTTTVTRPDGQTHTLTYGQQKHPVSCGEVQTWLQQQGFTIEQLHGDRAGHPFTPSAERAIFWARQTVPPGHRPLSR